MMMDNTTTEEMVETLLANLDTDKSVPAIARLNNHAMQLAKQGELGVAKRLLECAVRTYEQQHGRGLPMATMLQNLGLQFSNQEDYVSARVYYDRALAIQEKTAPQDDHLATLLSELGKLAARLDDMTSARAHYQRAIMVYSISFGPQHPESARCLVGMASTYRLVGLATGGVRPSSDDTGLALTYYEQALHIFDTKLGRDHPDTIDGLFRFACDLTHASQAQRAKPYLEMIMPL
jgi:tetratricopeptide (TPR) repeat protein